METKQNYVNLSVEDGSTMAAYIALPKDTTKPAPGLLLFQEAFGVNHHIRHVSDKFAADGFVVIAPELFHRTAPVHFEGSYTDFEGVMPHLKALTPEGMGADIKAAYKWLTEHDRVQKDKIYSIGYCMGGRASFLANTLLPLNAAVSYYGGGTDQLLSKVKDLHGPQLFFWGGQDHHIKSESIDTVIKALDEAGKDYVNVKISYADHGFNCNERASYSPKAAKESLALTLAFFANN